MTDATIHQVECRTAADASVPAGNRRHAGPVSGRRAGPVGVARGGHRSRGPRLAPRPERRASAGDARDRRRRARLGHAHAVARTRLDRRRRPRARSATAGRPVHRPRRRGRAAGAARPPPGHAHAVHVRLRELPPAVRAAEGRHADRHAPHRHLSPDGRAAGRPRRTVPGADRRPDLQRRRRADRRPRPGAQAPAAAFRRAASRGVPLDLPWLLQRRRLPPPSRGAADADGLGRPRHHRGLGRVDRLG